jgi:putative IMPACT (imprinted ancient) family translation regulator
VSGGARFGPAREGCGESEDRGSRFLARVFPAPNEEAFRVRLDALRAEHPKARHHCWARRIGGACRFSDDGEPGGTAGRPLLLALEAAGLDDAGVVCVRYFGGVLLGTGGLVRTYGTAAARAAQAAGRARIVVLAAEPLRLPFARLGLRDEIASLFPRAALDGAFDEGGWSGVIRLDALDLPRLRTLLRERGAG